VLRIPCGSAWTQCCMLRTLERRPLLVEKMPAGPQEEASLLSVIVAGQVGLARLCVVECLSRWITAGVDVTEFFGGTGRGVEGGGKRSGGDAL
jgi:hypothetical protein